MSSWDRLLNYSEIRPKFDKWLNDSTSIYFRIPNVIFKELNLYPGKLIPQYSKERLPKIIKQYRLEILRTGPGECILTKTGKGRNIKSIFPNLPEISDFYEGKPFCPIQIDSTLNISTLINEESGIFFALRSGILTEFLVENISVNSVFFHSGRINTNVQGNIIVSTDKIHIKSTQMECDALLESRDALIAVEVKQGFQKSFSIHQIAFPILLLHHYYPQKEILGLYIQFLHDPKWIFQLHLIRIEFHKDHLDLTNYQFLGAKEYRISLN